MICCSGALVLAVIGVALAMPRPLHLAGVYDMLCVAVLFPAAIVFGAGARERRPQAGRAAGNLSYAVYILHAPILSAMRMVDSRASGARAGIELALFALLLLGAVWWAQYRYHGPAERFLWRLLARSRIGDGRMT